MRKTLTFPWRFTTRHETVCIKALGGREANKGERENGITLALGTFERRLFARLLQDRDSLTYDF